MEKHSRRKLLKNAATTAAIAVTGAASLTSEAKAQTGVVWEKKAVHHVPAASPAGSPAAATASATPAPAKAPPLFNSIITFGNLIYIAGIGAHFAGTIEEHTKHVLDELEQNLILAGSSMSKALKVNVYLSDLANYAKMNSVYAGRWGEVPPVRTTVAVTGLPGNSLVEIDCIASL
ncbi:MAG: RidA family protein [Acidobacteriota bacterium]|nr:RidA family protein [Acidobacteriota bacterium]